jgi:hypothetical protein
VLAHALWCGVANHYRLIVELASPARADAVREELVTFFAAHAKEYDLQTEDPAFEWPGQPTEAARTFGARYGHAWKDALAWGDEQLAGDEPAVTTLGNRVVIHHPYTSGGFGPDLPAVLERAGGTLVETGAQSGKPVVYARFALAAKQALAPGLREQLEAEADGDACSFVIDAGVCTFTLPVTGGLLDEVKRSLADAPGLELRLATPADIATNRDLERRVAAASEASPQTFLEQTTTAAATAAGEIAVTTLFDYEDKANGADDLLIAGDEIIAFAGAKTKTQRLVVRGPSRKASNLTFPRAWLQGFWVEDDGTWRAGGDGAHLYVSADRGKTWSAEDHAGLEAALGASRIWSVVRFGGALWAASEGGVARQLGGAWQRVELPEPLHPAKALPNELKFLPRLAVHGDALYVLGKGIARWDGAALVVELACGHDLHAFVATRTGTLIAAGGQKIEGTGATATRRRGVWRRPRDGAWTLLPEVAISVADRDPAEARTYHDTFVALACESDMVVLVGRYELPGKQMNMLRVSDDDGQTFRILPAVAKGYLVGTAARADGRGGVFVAAQGGVLFRVSRDGLGSWAQVEVKPPRATKRAR